MRKEAEWTGAAAIGAGLHDSDQVSRRERRKLDAIAKQIEEHGRRDDGNHLLAHRKERQSYRQLVISVVRSHNLQDASYHSHRI